MIVCIISCEGKQEILRSFPLTPRFFCVLFGGALFPFSHTRTGQAQVEYVQEVKPDGLLQAMRGGRGRRVQVLRRHWHVQGAEDGVAGAVEFFFFLS